MPTRNNNNQTKLFIVSSREATSAPESAIPSAEELLKHCKWDAGGLRAGHVYALLISAAMAAGSLSMVSRFFIPIAWSIVPFYSWIFYHINKNWKKISSFLAQAKKYFLALSKEIPSSHDVSDFVSSDLILQLH